MSRRGSLFQARPRTARRASSGAADASSLYLQAVTIPSTAGAEYSSVGIMFNVTGSIQVTSAAIWVPSSGSWAGSEMRWQLWEVGLSSNTERASFLFSGTEGTLVGAFRVVALASPYTMTAGNTYIISTNSVSGPAPYHRQDDGSGYTVVSNFGGRIAAVGSVYDISSSGSAADPASGGTLYKYVRGNFAGVAI